MFSSFTRRLLQTAAGHRFSSPCARYRPVLTYFSAASSSAPSSLVQSSLIQSLKNRSAFIPLRFSSSKVGSDENLLKVLRSEIDCVQEFKDPRELEVPEGFPFEIIDNPGDQTITLKREFAGENIQALVYMNLDGEEDGGDDNKDDDTDQENSIQPSISLHVTIGKGDVPILEFGCNLNSDELEIESMARKSQDDSDSQAAYEGPNFSDLDESLQKALHKYLEVRGITSSLHGFLHEYMTNKDEREYLTWLKNIEVRRAKKEKTRKTVSRPGVRLSDAVDRAPVHYYLPNAIFHPFPGQDVRLLMMEGLVPLQETQHQWSTTQMETGQSSTGPAAAADTGSVSSSSGEFL